MNRKLTIIVLSIVICICSSCGNQHDKTGPSDAASLITNETVTETEETSEAETVIQHGIVYYDCELTPEIFFAETDCTETDLLPPECDPSENGILYADDIGFRWPIDYYESGSIISTDDTIYTTDGYDLSDFTGIVVEFCWSQNTTFEEKCFYANPDAQIIRIKNGEINYYYSYLPIENERLKDSILDLSTCSNNLMGKVTENKQLDFIVGDCITDYLDEWGVTNLVSNIIEVTVSETGYYVFSPDVKGLTSERIDGMLWFILCNADGTRAEENMYKYIRNCKDPYEIQIYKLEKNKHYYFRCGYGYLESGIGLDSEITISIKPFEF